MTATPGAPTIEDYLFAGDGVVPNNPRLPLIVYRGALETGGDAAASCVAPFDRNGWTGAWTNGVYAHHHYQQRARGARRRRRLGPREIGPRCAGRPAGGR